MTYSGLDLNAIAENQYGPGSRAVIWGSRNHAYDWRALKPDGSLNEMNIQGYIDQKFGSNSRLVLINGAGRYNWSRFEPFRMNLVVQPVLMVAQDLKYNMTDIALACQRVMGFAAYAQSWIRQRVGKTFEVAPNVQVLFCPDNSQTMLQIAKKTTEKNPDGSSVDRWALLNYHQDNYYRLMSNRVNSQIQYVCISYTGNHPKEDYGSANRGNLTALSSDNSSIVLNTNAWTPESSRAAYDFLHEILHGFGLQHSDQISDGPNYWRSIMYQGKPPDVAMLHPREINYLSTHPMLKVV